MIFTLHGTVSLSINSTEKNYLRNYIFFYINIVRIGVPLSIYSIQKDAEQDRVGDKFL